MVEIQETRDFIAAKFAAAEVDSVPTPHLQISNFFPDEVYSQILQHNLFKHTAGTEWIRKSRTWKQGQDTPFHMRKQVDLKEPIEASPEAREFWTKLERVFFEDNWFAKLVRAKYPSYFDIRFGDVSQNEDFFSKLQSTMFIQRHEKDFSIGPHTDAPTRVFTCIFSFPDRSGSEQYGTQFLRPKERMTQCSGYLHHKPEDFEVVKLAPYQPNNFVLFFRTNSSFHGVREIDREVANERYGMQIGFYEPKGGLMLDLSDRRPTADRTTRPLVDLKIFGRHFQVHRAI